MSKKAVIIGAGPAGLTAALELLEKSDIKPIVLEQDGLVGGISRTVNYKGNRIDIGGHRFFSKSKVVMEFWKRILPNDLVKRDRLSRILYGRKFYDYPVTLSLKTFSNLGMFKVFKVGISYFKTLASPIKNESSLEDFFINRFGEELYKTFFKDYTQKVWGVAASQIDPSWGAQRVKGVSITEAIKHALFHRSSETSLISEFLYPKLGPGQMWEEVAKIIRKKGGKIILGEKVLKINKKKNNIISVETQNNVYHGDYFISTMPISDLIKAMENVPQNVKEVAKGLVYRDFITVGILTKKLKTEILDNWIYIQEPDLKLARLQVFNNWSPTLVSNSKNIWLGAEYFVNEGDSFWIKSDAEIADFAKLELCKAGILDRSDVLDSVVIKMVKTYPAYFGTYNRFSEIKDYTDRFENLFLVGRNGMHRYNNQDHSMLTAMGAVANIINKKDGKDNIWAVNVEKDYQEKITSVENLTEGFFQSVANGTFQYNPDSYWEKTLDSYSYYPTVRHRKRFILNRLGEMSLNKDSFVFDFGCGDGGVLSAIQKKFGLSGRNLGGCDVSKVAIEKLKKEVRNGYFFNEIFPNLRRKADVIVCSEVIEHSKDFLQIIHWAFEHLKNGGMLILTTQSGRLYPSDIYTGHTQHFNINELKQIMKKMGFKISYSSLWGFPFLSLQKFLTKYNFEGIKDGFLEGKLSFKKRIVFGVVYLLYYLHDFVGFGPQIYIVAEKR